MKNPLWRNPMIVKTFGSQDQDTLLLLHGGGLSWWSYQKAAALFAAQHYHVVLPILDGHAGSDTPFSSIEQNAARIIAYIDTHFHGHIKMIAGLSLGAQILLEILSQRNNICDYAVVESALVIPMKLTNRLLAPCVALSYPMMKNRLFARLQFHSLHLPPELFEDYYRDTCLIQKDSLISFLKANSLYVLKDALTNTTSKVLIMVGGREISKMRRSAHKLHMLLTNANITSALVIFDTWNHGEASILHPAQYVNTIIQFMNQIY